MSEIEHGKHHFYEFNYNPIFRIHYRPPEILIAPNSSAPEFYFPIIKKYYELAKTHYESRQNTKD